MKVESVNEEESTHSSTDEFRRAISRVAAAQLCQSAGFESVQLSALDALSELVIRYVCEVSKAAQFRANLSGRTTCTVFDILRVLGEVEEDGHAGGSDADASGGIIKRCAEAMDDHAAPFSISLPRFPIACWVKRRVCFSSNGDAPPGKHIPDWLPKLPDPHTYIQTPVWDERTSDPKEDKVEQARQRRKAERSLLNLEQRLAIANGGGDGKGEEILPTVANKATVLMEDREPREVGSLPLEDGVMEEKRPSSSSVVDAFKPVIEALENGALDAPNGGGVPKKQRMVFRLGFNKRTLDMDVHLGVKRSRTGSLRALGVDEKDDKKRRAQVIIRESMDDPQELQHQL